MKKSTTDGGGNGNAWSSPMGWPAVTVRQVTAVMACVLVMPVGQASSGHGQASVQVAIERYAGGDFDGGLDGLTAGGNPARAVRNFRRTAERWVDEGPSVDRPRRLAVVSAMGVELFARGEAGGYAPDVFDREVRPLLAWTCDLLRRDPPSAVEHAFHLASIALLQGTRDEEMLLGLTYASTPFPRHPHVAHAGSRFPHEPRFKLAWVTARPEAQMVASWPISPGDLLTESRGRFRADPPGAGSRLAETVSLFDALVDDEEVGEEARLRRGVLLAVMDRREPALRDLQTASVSDDPFVRYLANLMVGLLDVRAGDREAAIERYRTARSAVPASAVSVALASALFEAGRAAEAAEVLADWRASERPEDPWRVFGNGEYRRFGVYLARVRELVRQ